MNMAINIIDGDPIESSVNESINVVTESENLNPPVHIDQNLKSNVDQYIEKHEGVPKPETHYVHKRVQQQTLRFGDDEHLQTNAPISMLIPLSIRPRRNDTFMSLDDYTIPPEDFETYPQYKESFTECLRKYLICKNLDDNFVYENANLAQLQWAAIISNKDFKPDKHTAIAIALTLRLNMDETMDLLQAAELELSHDHVFDLIIEYSINCELYDVLEVNEILTEFKQPLLC